MIYSQNELARKIKSREFFNFYVFYGEEEYLIKSYIKKIIDSFNLKDFLDFNYKKCYFEDFNFDEMESFLNMAPVLKEKRIFILKDVDMVKFLAKDIEQLKNILKDMPKSSILIFTLKGESSSFKKTSSFKKLVSCGFFVEFLYKSENFIFNSTLKSIEKNGFSISREDLIFFIRRCGRSIERLNIEIKKIFAFVEKGEIKREVILNLTMPSIEENAFNIAKNLLAGKKTKAIKIFYELEETGTSIFLIFGAISCCFLDLYRAKCAKLKGIKEYEILKYYDYKGKEFRIKNAFRNCNLYSIEELRGFINLLFKIDVFFKTKNISKEFLLEWFLKSV